METEKNDKTWSQKLNLPQVQFYIKNGDQNMPSFKSVQVFNKKYEIEKLAQIIFSPCHIEKWDKNVKEVKNIPISDLLDKKSCFQLVYTLNK